MRNVNISASIPVELNLKIEKIAKQENRSKNFIIKRCLEKSLNDTIDFEEGKIKKWDFKEDLELSIKENMDIIKALANK